MLSEIYTLLRDLSRARIVRGMNERAIGPGT
jgi:hypothetical protein